MSSSLSDRRGGEAGASASDGAGSLRVEVEFAGVNAEQAQAVAAEMIARAHQLANAPEFQCDVDVSVQLTGQPGAAAPGQRASETVLAPVAEGDVPSGAPAADERTAIR